MKLPKFFKSFTERKAFAKAFTLIELIIVVGIISILTAAALPSFGTFADRRIFQNNVDEFANQIRDVRSKAIAGATNGGVKANWKITATNSSNAYSLGYIPTSGAVEENLVSKTLSGSGVTFSCTNCKVEFERLTGKRLSGTSGSSQDIAIAYKSEQRTIKIYETGKVVITNP